jgi:hypothetical protein
MCLVGRQFAVPERRRYPAIHEEIAAGNECAVGAHQQGRNIANLIGRARAFHGTAFNHAPVASAARTRELIFGQWRDDDTGTDRIQARASLAQRTASNITRSELPRFDS